MKQGLSLSFFGKPSDQLPKINENPTWQIITGLEQTFFFNKQTGDIYGIGLNEYTSLGILTYPVNELTKIPHRTNVFPKTITVAAQQSFIFYHDDKLYATGRNSSHQLGKVAIQYDVPFREVLFPNNQHPIQVAIVCLYGNFDTLFLTEDKQLYSYKKGLIVLPDHQIPKKIVAAYNHILILSTAMNLFGLGFNSNHQLGHIIEHENQVRQPQLIQLCDSFKIKDIFAKGLFSLIWSENNQLYFSGQCLSEDTKYLVSKDFIKLPLPDDVQIKNVFVGEEHIIILSTANILYGYGSNKEGQLGLGESIKIADSFQQIKLPTESLIYDVSTGYDYTFVLCENNELFGFGDAHHQLGKDKGSYDFLPQALPYIKDLNKLYDTPCEDAPACK